MCWLHAGIVLSDNVVEPLSLAIDGCVPEGTNFTQIAIASYDRIMESGTWNKLYQMLIKLDVDPLAAAFGNAGGFAVICGYLGRDILKSQRDFRASRIDFEKSRGVNGNDFSAAWIEVNKFGKSGNGRGNTQPSYLGKSETATRRDRFTK